ncbi:MAG: hypothetical protein WD533_00665 [Dehalococcoidia bacterium]
MSIARSAISIAFGVAGCGMAGAAVLAVVSAGDPVLGLLLGLISAASLAVSLRMWRGR